MLQSGFPSEEEQVAQYQGMLQMFNDKPVTLRTLDVGADKQLPYMLSVKRIRVWDGGGFA